LLAFALYDITEMSSLISNLFCANNGKFLKGRRVWETAAPKNVENDSEAQKVKS